MARANSRACDRRSRPGRLLILTVSIAVLLAPSLTYGGHGGMAQTDPGGVASAVANSPSAAHPSGGPLTVVGFLVWPLPLVTHVTEHWGIQAHGGTAPYTFHWAFGDGGTATSITPGHAYTTPGNYTVFLNLTDHLGATASYSRLLRVNGPGPFTVTAINYAPFPAQYGEMLSFGPLTQGGLAPITAENWSFGDGSGTITGINPSHNYTAPGNYTVYVNATDSTPHTASFHEVLWVRPVSPLVVRIQVDTLTPHVLQYVHLVANVTGGRATGYRYHWAITDYPSFTVPDVKATWSLIGTYGIYLNVTDGAVATGHAQLNISVQANSSLPRLWNVTPGCAVGGYNCIETTSTNASGTPLSSWAATSGSNAVFATNPYGGSAALLVAPFNDFCCVPTQTPIFWTWSNGVWTNDTAGAGLSSIAPSPQDAMAWDPLLRGYVLVAAFGSLELRAFSGGGYWGAIGPGAPGPEYNDPAYNFTFYTYLFSDGSWSNISSSVGIPTGPLQGTIPALQMVWDPSVGALVLGEVAYGPSNVGSLPGFIGDFSTWELGSADGGVWVNQTANAGAPTAGSPLMAYDSSTGQVVLFAEVNESNVFQTWTLGSNNSWTVHPVSYLYPPLGFEGGCAATLMPLGPTVLLLFGGKPCSFATEGKAVEVWNWTGSSWSNVTVHGPIPTQDGTPQFAGAVSSSTSLLWSGDVNGSFGGVDNYTTVWTCTSCAPPAANNTTVTNTSSCSEVRVNWTNPIPPPGEYIENVTLDVYAASGALVQAIVLPGDPSATFVFGLACGATYRFVVLVAFTNGLSSSSHGVTFTTATIAALTSSAICATGTPFWALALIGLLLLIIVIMILVSLYLHQRATQPPSRGRERGRNPPKRRTR